MHIIIIVHINILRLLANTKNSEMLSSVFVPTEEERNTDHEPFYRVIFPIERKSCENWTFPLFDFIIMGCSNRMTILNFSEQFVHLLVTKDKHKVKF